MGGILDDPQVVRLRQRLDSATVDTQTGKVHRHDGLRSFGDGEAGRVQVDVQGHGVDVHDDRVCPQVANDLGRRRERPGRNDDLIAWSDSEPLEGEVQPCRCRVDRDSRDAAAEELGKLGLESGRTRTRRQPPRAHRSGGSRNLLLADVGERKGDELVSVGHG